MSVVGELSVVITADAKGLKKGLKASNKALKVGGKELRKNVNEWAKWGAAAVAAVGAVTATLIKSNLDQIREIKNLAEAANTSVDVFQRQAFAAEGVGIATEKYGDILKDVNDRIGDFITSGAGPMVDFFEQIGPKVGVTIDQFKRLSGAEALQLYVSSIEKANVSQAEMIFFMEAMAGDSAKLLPLLKNNGKAMREQAEAARKLGIGLSEIDVARVEEANNALAAAAGITSAQLQKATVALAPFITAIVEEFAEASGTMEDLEETVVSGMRNSVRAVMVFADGVHGIKVIFKGIEVAARGFNGVAASAFAGLMVLVTDLGNTIIDTVATIVRGYGEIAKLIDQDYAKPFEEAVEVLEGFKADPSAFIDFANAQVDAIRITKDELNKMLQEKLPSQKVDEFFDEVEKSAEVAGKKMKRDLQLERLSTEAMDGFFDSFRSQARTSADLFKDSINGLELETTALDAFFQVASDGSAKTQLKIREALEGKGLNMAEIDRLFAFINTKAKESGNILNVAMGESLDENSIQVFFDLLNNKKDQFGNIMEEMFSGENLDPEGINTFIDGVVEKAKIDGEQIRQNLIGSGISEEEADAFLNAYLEKTREHAGEIAKNLGGGLTAEGDESEDIGSGTGTKGFAQQELLDAMATETEWLQNQHDIEIEMLAQAQARKLELGQSFEEAQTEMTKRHAQERADAVEAEMNARFATTRDLLGGANQLAQSMGKKGLKIQQAISLASAAMAIATGIARAQELGFPANIAEMARVAAVGINAISSIKSAGSGGGSVSRPSGGGGGGVASARSSGGNSGNQENQNRIVDLNFVGEGLMNTDQVRNLMGQIVEEANNGVTFNITGG